MNAAILHQVDGRFMHEAELEGMRFHPLRKISKFVRGSMKVGQDLGARPRINSQ